jgi:hypothetical protein
VALGKSGRGHADTINQPDFLWPPLIDLIIITNDGHIQNLSLLILTFPGYAENPYS